MKIFFKSILMLAAVATLSMVGVSCEPADEGTPTEQPNENPNENPNDNPGEEPGDNPGENPGEDPGENPGENPGEEPGEEPGEPRIGDIYYSDGSWNSELVEGKTPVGVIFCLGTGRGDSAANYKTKAGEAIEEITGYVVALRDATENAENEDGVVWSFYDGWYNGAGCSSELEDFLGYSNTQAIKAAALRDDCPAGEFNGTNDSFPAAWYASDGYELLCPSPETSSGWYLPSLYQIKYIWDKTYFNDGNMLASVEETLVMLAEQGLATEMYANESEYWSSTEKYDSYGDSCMAYYFCFDKTMFKPGFGADLNKYWEVRVRSVLTF